MYPISDTAEMLTCSPAHPRDVILVCLTGQTPGAAVRRRGAGTWRSPCTSDGTSEPSCSRLHNPLKSNWIPPQEQSSNHIYSLQMFNYKQKEVFACFRDYKKKTPNLLHEGTGRKSSDNTEPVHPSIRHGIKINSVQSGPGAGRRSRTPAWHTAPTLATTRPAETLRAPETKGCCLPARR